MNFFFFLNFRSNDEVLRSYNDGTEFCFIENLRGCLVSMTEVRRAFAIVFGTNDPTLHLGSSQRCCMDHLHDDILRDCIFVHLDPNDDKTLMSVLLTSKRFGEVLKKCQPLWRSKFLLRWPLQNPSLRMRSWWSMYARRHRAWLEEPVPRNPVLIENCTLSFECPLRFSELQPLEEPDAKEKDEEGGGGGGLVNNNNNNNNFVLPKKKNGITQEERRFCKMCNQVVYRTSSVPRLKQLASEGQCVAFMTDPSILPKVVGLENGLNLERRNMGCWVL